MDHHQTRRDSADPISDEELAAFILRHLPKWDQAAHEPETDAIVLHESNFGDTEHEFFLLASAVKFAARKGKHVHVVTGSGKLRSEPESALPNAELHSIHREESQSQEIPRRKRGRPRKIA